jgi:hypothetical protein
MICGGRVFQPGIEGRMHGGSGGGFVEGLHGGSAGPGGAGGAVDVGRVHRAGVVRGSGSDPRPARGDRGFGGDGGGVDDLN